MADRQMSVHVTISAADQASAKIKAAAESLHPLEAGLRKAQTAAEEFRNKWSESMEAARGVGTVMTAAGAGAMALAKSGLDASMEMEGYAAKLKVAMKDAGKAAEMLDWAKQTAAKTPFEMPDVVNATVKLQMYGLEAKHWFPLVGDMAGAMGKSVDDALEAVADALSGGGLERLKEFGVTSGQLKDLGWSGDYSAKGLETLRVALENLMKSRFSGGMQELTNTSKGALSNFSDAVFQARAAVGDALTPALKQLTPILVNMATKLAEMARSPIGQMFIKAGIGVGAFMLAAGPLVLAMPKIVESVVWLKAALGVGGLATAANSASVAMAGANGVVPAGKALGAALGTAGANVATLGKGLLRWIVSPQGQVTAALTGIAFGIGLLVKMSADAQRNLKDLNEEIGITLKEGETPEASGVDENTRRRMDLMRQMGDIDTKRAKIRGVLDHAFLFGFKTRVFEQIGGDEGVRKYEDYYEKLTEQRDKLRAQYDAIPASVPKRAKGGPVSPGQPYLVGEQGPELFTPDLRGHIMTYDESKRLMAQARETLAVERVGLPQATRNSLHNFINGLDQSTFRQLLQLAHSQIFEKLRKLPDAFMLSLEVALAEHGAVGLLQHRFPSATKHAAAAGGGIGSGMSWPERLDISRVIGDSAPIRQYLGTARQIAQQMARVPMRVHQKSAALLAEEAKAFGGRADDWSKLMAGRRAGGGPVQDGLAYLVGEAGPEAFVPGSPGTIIPSGDLSQRKRGEWRRRQDEAPMIPAFRNDARPDELTIRLELALEPGILVKGAVDALQTAQGRSVVVQIVRATNAKAPGRSTY